MDKLNSLQSSLKKLPAKIRILADENIVGLDVFFKNLSSNAEVEALIKISGRTISADDLVDIDILLVRSVTQVTKALLAKANKLLFVGSATIGTDHIDLKYLHSRNIIFACAPGCNAQGVCEYVLAAVGYLKPQIFSSDKLKFAVLGYGNTGSRVYQALAKLNVNVGVCDPFKQTERNSSDNEGAINFISFEELLEADVISLHVPLTHHEKYATHELFTKAIFSKIKTAAVFINTSRGDVLKQQDLLNHAQLNPQFTMALDVWQNEPAIDQPLVERCAIATPHIAGYSFYGKWRGTLQLYQALHQYFDIGSESVKSDTDFPALEQSVEIIAEQNLDSSLELKKLHELFYFSYDILEDDKLLRNIFNLETELQAKAFDGLRKNYKQRCEWQQTSLSYQNEKLSYETAKLKGSDAAQLFKQWAFLSSI